jgi:hypothetical protein
MPAREVWDVEPRGDDGWAVQREGTDRADSLHMAKDTAIARGVELAKAAGSTPNGTQNDHIVIPGLESHEPEL